MAPGENAAHLAAKAAAQPPAKNAGKGAPKKRPRVKYAYEVAPDVQARLEEIVRHLPDDFRHVDTRRVVCYRSRGSTARIYARIWALPGIWQAALGVEPHYVIEVVERFDRDTLVEQEKTLIHELMHIPKTFSGNLVPHKCFGKNIDCSSVDVIYARLEVARGIEARARMAAAGRFPSGNPDASSAGAAWSPAERAGAPLAVEAGSPEAPPVRAPRKKERRWF